mmetsp:Transcript_25857/g.43114  ORF Transcript_25857/g.43114 Transcript_25857/m.43114 type:complete len:109 (-) Transcript_25857:79-405(-)
MSKARDIIERGREEGSEFYNWISNSTKSLFTVGPAVTQWCYMNGRIIGWWIVTTGMLTALPLIFEIKREAMLEDLEKMQVDSQLAEGRTPQELAVEGLTSAVDPKVLK